MSITINPYSSENSSEVNKLFIELQIFEHQFDASKSTTVTSAKKYKEELLITVKEQHGELLVAKTDDKAIGLVAWYIENEPEFSEPYGYISDIVVSQDHRGQGIGQQLLDMTLRHIKAAGVKRVHLGVLVGNTATKKFYRKNGFADYSIEMTKALK